MEKKFEKAALEVAVLVEERLLRTMTASEAAEAATQVASSLFALLCKQQAEDELKAHVAENMYLPWR